MSVILSSLREIGARSCLALTFFVYLYVNLKTISIMKKDMKKLLVIVMALMPSLSILAMNPSGYDLMPVCAMI